MNRSFRRMFAPAVLLLSAACADLDVVNLNQPDVARALATPGDVANVAYSSVISWYQAATHYEPAMALQVTADAATANFGNFGMRFNNLEPRTAYFNLSSNGDQYVARRPWEGFYGALGAANDALAAIDLNGIVIPGANNTDKARAAALFAQAASLSGLAMTFDKAFVVDEDLVGLPSLVPYADVRTAAMLKWDEFLTLTAGKSWSWEAAQFPTGAQPPTALWLNRIGNTMAARTLMLTARNGAENTATNWTRVLAYADKGITGTGLVDRDLTLEYDGNNWYDYIKLYGNLDNWTRVDQRLINRMAPNIPAKFNGLPAQTAPVPVDNRLGSATLPCGTNPTSCIVGKTNDYLYLGTVIGDPGRGIYMQSPFYHQRWRHRSFAIPGADRNGPVPYILATENNLIIAEALTRTNTNLTRAAALVNLTRVTRGGLAPVAATQAALLAAIDYERDVELLNTNGLSLFDARRLERLQPGTLRNLPVPANELEVLGLAIYTFGGTP